MKKSRKKRDKKIIIVTEKELAIRFITGFLVIAFILFFSAGTIRWIEGWIYLIVQLSYARIVASYLKKNDPGLLKKRLDLKLPKRIWDKVIIILVYVSAFFMFIMPSLDKRFSLSYISPYLEVFGFIGIVLGSLMMFWAMRENSYLSRVVEIQKSRKQIVITTGPYSIIRHPMYLGAIIFMICFPIALGSWYGLIASALITFLLVIRTYFEDKTLRKELKGYSEYVKKTKYKLIPHIW